MENETKTPHETHHGMPEIPKVDLKSVNAAALKGGVTDVLEIVKLNQSRMDAVAKRDSEGITMALVYLAIGALAAPLGGAVFGYSVLGTVFRTPIVSALIGAVVAIVLSVLGLYITNLVAVKLFKGQGKFPEYFRVMGYASLINVVGLLSMVSVLGSIAGIWLLVINFKALMSVHKLDTTNAVLTIIVSVVVSVVLTFLVTAVGLTALMGVGAGTVALQ
jgi:hypothetical protein